MDEFQLIDRIRQWQGEYGAGTIIGIGDDAAVLDVPEGQELVITTDTLNSGIHFDSDVSPADLGHKSLAVNLSDLAAMGAKPQWVLLSISLSESEIRGKGELWTREFFKGFLGLATRCGVELIGGDTCAGSLSITVTAIGLVRRGEALTRSGAKPGDLVVVSGTLGDAALALSELKSGVVVADSLTEALFRPVPRISLGLSLGAKATSCIDISDGLWADLGHIAFASGCGAQIWWDRLPSSHALNKCGETSRRHLQLNGGEDYELCFTIDPSVRAEMNPLSDALDLKLTVIGEMTEGTGVACLGADGIQLEMKPEGYEHFK